jgi:hypothetical protein
MLEYSKLDRHGESHQRANSNQNRSGDTEHLIKTMLRDCVELCARVAEQRAANGVAMAIRRLKPPATWP